ncbi:WGxxGxxG family protein [Arthrobacter sp. MDT2-16]|uniref:WGxxGxxG family protein n=1 Tax=Arthrobacter ruber TaxID=1258893 RepID=UPI00197A99D5|nr:WGxxGxxG family protein [Arthrobacter ruber]
MIRKSAATAALSLAVLMGVAAPSTAAEETAPATEQTQQSEEGNGDAGLWGLLGLLGLAGLLKKNKKEHVDHRVNGSSSVNDPNRPGH